MTAVANRGQGPATAGAPERGLSSTEAAKRLRKLGPPHETSSRSTASIVAGNVFTLFNAIIGFFGVLILSLGLVADAAFLAIAVVNSYIGIRQELKAKRTLDELAVLVAPHAKVVRDGEVVSLLAEEVVPGDVVAVEPGDQLVADGELIASRGLTLDESLLTGEADGVRKGRGERALSGSFGISGSGHYLVDAVRERSYAGRLAGEARAFRHPPSPLQHEVNRVIVACTYTMVPLAILLLLTFQLRHVGLVEAAQTATAGLVTLIPEGMVLLMSVTFAVAAVRLARRDTLVQQMSATESLAAVDTICVDKTGTLTDGELRLLGLEVAEGVDPEEAQAALGRFAASAGERNRTLETIAAAFPGKPGRVGGEVPFSSRWKWSGLTLGGRARRSPGADRGGGATPSLGGGVTYVLGAPDVLERAGALSLPPGLARKLAEETAAGRRIVAFGESSEALPDDAAVEGGTPDGGLRGDGTAGPGTAGGGAVDSGAGSGLGTAGMSAAESGAEGGAGARPAGSPPPLRALALVVLEETLRPDAAETIAFIREEGVDLKLISGDARATVTAVAYAVGVPAEAGVIEGSELPEDPEELAAAALGNTIFCRIAPEQKKALVEALRASGRYTAMIGDGVNDVPALKQARLAVAMGSGAQVTKGVADVVLLKDEFARLPQAIAEGRRIARNIHRLGRLYLTKTVYAAALILLVAVPGFAFPFLPRHLTLAVFLTIGIPSFVLALAPSDGPLYRGRLLRALAAFAVPAGLSTALGSILCFFLVDTVFGGSLEAGRTAATTTLIVLGLSFVLLLERGPGREHIAIQSYMLAMVAGLGALFALILAAAPVRDFFEMTLLSAGQWFAALLCSAVGLTIASLLWRLPQIEGLEAVGEDRTETVGEDRTETVGEDRTGP